MRWDARLYDEAKGPQVDAGRELIDMACVRPGDHVLDLGCGTGMLSVALAFLAPEGKVVGLDPSEEMIARASKAAEPHGNMTLVRLAAQDMDYNGEFDLVFSNSALQWIKEQRQVLGLVLRALKAGGRVAFQLPARDFCGEFFRHTEDAIAGLGLDRYYEGWEPPWYLPSREEYEAVLEEAGFENVDVSYRDYRLVFDDASGALRWWASAGLRPYLEPLPEKEREYFRYAFAMGFENNRTDKVIEFGFRRLFALARKSG